MRVPRTAHICLLLSVVLRSRLASAAALATVGRSTGRAADNLHAARQAVCLLQLILQVLTAPCGGCRGAGDCPQVSSRAVAVRLFQRRRILWHLQ